jgi:hypothetical protein
VLTISIFRVVGLKTIGQADQKELLKLQGTQARLSYIAEAEIKLNELCQQVRQNLSNATIYNKRLALDILDIRIVASTGRIDIKGCIPVEATNSLTSADVTTIEQTSGCIFFYRNINIKLRTHQFIRRPALLLSMIPSILL